MNKKYIIIVLSMFLTGSLVLGKGNNHKKQIMEKSEFNYSVDRFADVEVLRYQVPGFEQLSLNQKKLVYYLAKAAEAGRDILYDQNCKYNLDVRKTLEAIYLNYQGDKFSEDYKGFEIYLKRVLFSNGIHHHYGMEKFVPDFSKEFLHEAIADINDDKLPISDKKSRADLLIELDSVIFDPNVASKRVNQAEGEDLIKTSACNYYQGVNQKEVEAFYDAMRDSTDKTPISYGLNSRLEKVNGKIVEDVYKVGGLYSKEIEDIIKYLNLALTYAENNKQKQVIESLIDYYKTGDLKIFDDYSIKWLADTDSRIDFVNGFIETYGDPLGLKASWESIVNFKDIEATKRTETISLNAQWFEDNSPVDERFKKKQVKGVTAKVITVAMLGGDCYPPTPIGINLPNANWIRQVHGSKSVTIGNITNAYVNASRGNGFDQEFMYSNEEIENKTKYGAMADELHTDLHECLGHGSGQMLPGVNQELLKAYGATLEEARADLFGLYYIADKKIVDLKLLPNKDAYKAGYYSYMMNGLITQLARIKPGFDIEESHMRNRQLIAKWVYEHGKSENVVELVNINGKTYVKINDYNALRNLFGKLLAEVQRIKSEGDYEAAKNLVENYGVKVDQELHKEVLLRYKKLNIAPYKGFVNPKYILITNDKGEITDIKLDYTENFIDQQLRYDHLK